MSNEVGYGKPPKEHRFKPGDKRINRDGRPTTSAGLSELARRIGHEVATKKNGETIIGPDGRPLTVIEMILRQWAQNPKQQSDFIDRGWGKVPTPVDITSKGERITGYAAVSPDDWDGEKSNDASDSGA